MLIRSEFISLQKRQESRSARHAKAIKNIDTGCWLPLPNKPLGTDTQAEMLPIMSTVQTTQLYLRIEFITLVNHNNQNKLNYEKCQVPTYCRDACFGIDGHGRAWQ